MTKQPLVSVFLPYYNDRDYLGRAIESVLKQTYQNWELILCNHATTDDCREIAHSYNDSRIKHVDMSRNEGAGGGLVFETMLNAASGEYIKTLCADDMLKPDCLTIMVDFMESHPDVDFAFGNLEYIDKRGRNLKDSWFESRSGFSINDTEPDLIRKYASGISILPYVGNISRREIFNDIEINKTFIMLFDMSLWLQLLCCGHKCAFINEKVCQYRIHPGQMSSAKKEQEALYVSWFEHQTFDLFLLNINNVELAKKVFPKSKYVRVLKDAEDIPFFVSVEMMKMPKPIFDVPLTKMLNDEKTRKHLIDTFGFCVKELRELRRSTFSTYLDIPSQFVRYKQKIYNSNASDINFSGVLFLLLRRLFKFVTFSKYRQRDKTKKNVSL